MQAQTQSSLKSIIGQALPQHSSSTSWTGNSVLHRCPVGTGGWTGRTQHLHVSARTLLPPHKLCPKPIPAAHRVQLCLCSQTRHDPVPPALVPQAARERKKRSWHGFSNSSLAGYLLVSFRQKDTILSPRTYFPFLSRVRSNNQDLNTCSVALEG